MGTTEKRTEPLPVIRIEETLLVLWKHEFGHARTVGDDGQAVTDFGALQSDARRRA